MGKSVMQHQFGNSPSLDKPRAVFDRSSSLKTAFDAGYLIPIYCDEVLPGDTMDMRAFVFARLATPIYPIFDNIFIDLHWFEVPFRQVCDEFKKLMGEQINPGDSIDYTMPIMAAPASVGHGEESLSDYLGIPTKIADLEHISTYHRAYASIYNHWFPSHDRVGSGLPV